MKTCWTLNSKFNVTSIFLNRDDLQQWLTYVICTKIADPRSNLRSLEMIEAY